jgi:hypothetical protein
LVFFSHTRLGSSTIFLGSSPSGFRNEKILMARKQLPRTPSAEATGDSATELTRTERRIAEERTAPRAAVIHEAIRAEGNL